MAAAACGLQSTSAAANKQQAHKDQLRLKTSKTSRDSSRRRQAALLFLNNISLDGRTPPVPLSNGSLGQRDAATGEHRRRHHRQERDLSSVPSAAQLLGGGGGAPQVSPSLTRGTTATTGGGPIPPGILSPVISFSSPGIGGGMGAVSFESAVSLDSITSSPPDTTPLSPPSTTSTQSFLTSAKPSAGLFSPVSTNSVLLDSRQRSRNISGSPGPKASKKVHFIKNMRQYDTRRSRIMLICAKRSLYAAFSVLPYGESVHLSDPKMESQKPLRSSVVTPDLLPALEGVELGMCGTTVSYAQFLYPTNALVKQKSFAAQTPQSRNRINSQRSFTLARLNSTLGQDNGTEDLVEYDPNLLSDPQWPCGRHKRVLLFASYVTTVIEYVKPSDLKKDMNETFREKFPHIKLTLSKIRSLKREMRAVSEECGLQPVTTAMAFVYFEKLVLQGRLNKQNRKLVSAACVLLAAKISSDLRKQEVTQLIDKLEERFRINRRELIPLEFPVLVALEMGLYLPESKVMPHYRRLTQN